MDILIIYIEKIHLKNFYLFFIILEPQVSLLTYVVKISMVDPFKKDYDTNCVLNMLLKFHSLKTTEEKSLNRNVFILQRCGFENHLKH
jgi:hypothetical protein